MKSQIKTEWKNLLMILAASFIYAAGLSLFLDPNQLAPGGITGIAVILNRVIPIETGTLYFLLNIPVMLLGIWKFGFRFILKTAVAITLISGFTNWLQPFGALTDDLLMSGATGGIFIAVGIGMIFKAGATTGGADIIIKLFRSRYRHLKTGFLFLCFDVIVVLISGIVFGNLNIVFYALATVVISGKALDYVLYGSEEAKLIYIITEKSFWIGNRLMKELEVGITYLQGKGGWSGKEKQVIFCVVQKRLRTRIEEIVRSEDPAAFMVITSASEIYGEGYKDFFSEIL